MSHLFRLIIFIILSFGLLLNISCTSTSKNNMNVVDGDVPPEASINQSNLKVSQDLNGATSYSPLKRAIQSNSYPAIVTEASKLLSKNYKDTNVLNSLGLWHLNNGRLTTAAYFFDKSKSYVPNKASTYNNLGVLSLKRNLPDLAFAQFKKANNLDANYLPALINLGNIYLKNGNFIKSKNLLENALVSEKSNLELKSNYAVALRGSGQHMGAEEVYKQILATHPNHSGTLVNYSILLVEFLNKPTEGLAMLKLARSAGNMEPQTLKTINKLETKILSKKVKQIENEEPK